MNWLSISPSKEAVPPASTHFCHSAFFVLFNGFLPHAFFFSFLVSSGFLAVSALGAGVSSAFFSVLESGVVAEPSVEPSAVSPPFLLLFQQ